ncbi:MAG: hypothetical protein OXU23_17090, partial [Candidatus Poribacteria bacterium]|nr:hypothetical protein [Candidatus Poribacteria bacterium]
SWEDFDWEPKSLGNNPSVNLMCKIGHGFSERLLIYFIGRSTLMYNDTDFFGADFFQIQQLV